MASNLESETLAEHLPEDSITSLRRLQTLYGSLAEAAGEKGGDPRYSIYYTPGELEEFVAQGDDDDRYLAQVDVDLTDTPPGVDEVSISIEQLTRDLVPKLGFARYPWGVPPDHSITRRGSKSGSDVDTVAGYCIDCLIRWTDGDDREPAVGKVAETHPDGWILEALQSLGHDDDVTEAIKDSVARKFSGQPRVVATVRLKLDPNDITESPADASDPDWFYPGAVDVLNAGMKARKEEKLARKNLNDSDEPSRGQGTCMVTDEETEVFGTAEDPLALFTVQHAEKFDELKRPNAWREHALSSDAALLIQSGSSLVEACRTTRNGLGVYTLPYFRRMSEDRANLLFRALTGLQERDEAASDEHPMAFIERVVEEAGSPELAEELRFYVITLRNDSGDINVFYEFPDVTLYWPRQVARSYHEILFGSTAFDEVAGFGKADEWSLLGSQLSEDNLVNAVVSGSFAWNAVPTTDSDDGAAVDDDIEWYTYQLLTGSTIPVGRLLDLFVSRLQHERTIDAEDRLSINHLKVQFAQLEALAHAGLLEGTGELESLTKPPVTMDTDDLDLSTLTDEDGSVPLPAARRYRLETFVESREALRDSPARRGAFLCGVLLGQLSHHQQDTREMNRTLRQQYQAENMTAGKLKNLYPKLSDKAGVYASEVDWGGETLFPETIDHLTDALSKADLESLSRQDLQFFYALGVGYGTRAKSRAYDLIEHAEATEA